LTDSLNTSMSGLACPTPPSSFDVIRLGHGSGGKLTADLIESLFLPALGNEVLRELDDAAVVTTGTGRIAVTTDSYVVNPIFFPGGDIGSLSVHGTVNDLAMRGAKPLFLSMAFILEEGLPLEELKKIVVSVSMACQEARVKLVAADTKVVNRGAADKLFITTAGIGIVEIDTPPAASNGLPGDIVMVSGDLGMHGMAIMCAREGLDLETTLESDSLPLNGLVQDMLAAVPEIHCLRDLTRGGLASAANELAQSSNVGMELDEEAIPVHPQVRAACELLGLDPLYVASEGRLMAVVPESSADRLLAAAKTHRFGSGARAIGRLTEDHRGRVVLRSRIGGRRLLDKLSGEQLPRIC